MTTTIDPRQYVAPTDLLAGRVILITGSSDGLGRALAIACARVGATVVLHGRKVRKLEQVNDEIVAAGYPRPSIVPLDFEKAGPDEYGALAEAMAKEYGRLDGLVHNAGMLGDRSPIEHHDVPKWLRTLHVNANAPFILTKYCLPLLKKAADASIVFVSSGVVDHARAYWGAYLVSKWAAEGLSRMLADELENDHVRVNSVNPGKMRTEMRLQAYPAEDRSLLPEPEVVLAPFLYLLGGDSSGVSGQRLQCQ
ncbi:MAG TPA: YciK family oxidoreductase [Steroidobacteraceae bacterium]|nr:YciK family oxidoreductase [Steroidobacteraceae bacterium]